MNKSLATGSRDELGQRQIKKQQLINQIYQYLNEQDYLPIKTPLIERRSTFAEFNATKMFHLQGQYDEELVIRPDLTLPIARFLATNRVQANQTNFYYVGDVVRKTKYLSGKYNQRTQAGIELIGKAGVKPELQAIQTMLEICQLVGVSDLKLVLGNAKFIDCLLEQETLTTQERQTLKCAIINKNMSIFNQLKPKLKNLPAALQEWPLVSEVESQDLVKQLQQLPAVHQICSELLMVMQALKKAFPDVTVTVDFASVTSQSYYTGLMFSGLITNLGERLFSGGRYDQLIKNVQNETLPAVGAEIEVDELVEMQPAVNAEKPKPLVFVLAKGRVEADVRQLLRQAGVNNEELNHPGRKLIFTSPDQRYQFILVKPTDVIKYLDSGVGDVGIVGSDTMAEQEQQHYDALDLQTGKAEFVLAAPDGFALNAYGRKRIATKYPRVATNYFAHRGEDVELVKLEGSVELGPLTGLADAIIDIKQSGNTLKENHLRQYETLGTVSTHLLVRPESFFKFESEIKQLIRNLLQVMEEEQ
ncbi:ATP phosphoribosyltransferase [Fructilactobacillus frigidiflavus]|uniref:ATP phosphoribosyltransferase n=1 Tax=Fructilactobacillus frigidiflavus TaxID=3242688 RepID=UPI003757D6B7